MNSFAEVRKLNFSENEFAIFGSSSLVVRNLRQSDDIDLIVKKDLWDKLSQKYKVEGSKNNLIKIGKIEIWNDWLYLKESVEELIDDSEIIDGLPFVKLKYVLEWKKKMNREKDIEDIKLIEEFLRK